MKKKALVVDDNGGNLLLEKDLLEVAGILRKDKETRDIPIIFVTASVMAEGREEIDSIPNTGFIGKPIDTRTFAKAVSDFIK